jgi:hypothetical protein
MARFGPPLRRGAEILSNAPLMPPTRPTGGRTSRPTFARRPKAVAPPAARRVNSASATNRFGEIEMKPLLSASFAAALLLAAPAWAQSAKEPANQTPEQNQKMSRDYQGMVSANPGFRSSRMHKECDSIASEDLKQQCMSSFGASNSGAAGNKGSMGSKPAPLAAPKR